jgi:hypothetical protein
MSNLAANRFCENLRGVGGPSFREVAKGWGLCLAEGSFAYTLS